MSIYDVNCLRSSTLIFFGVMFACAVYTYLVNAKRSADDPKKREYHPAAVFMAPVTIPIFIFAWISLFLIKVLSYGFFLLLFIVGFIVIRKPFIFIWLDKVMTKVGTMLLEANMLLIKLFFSPA